jgi:hypothetical protein
MREPTDLDIKPAITGQAVQACRVFPDANTTLQIHFKADDTNWTLQTSVKVTANAEDGTLIGSQMFDQKTNGASFQVHVAQKQFHALVVEAENTPQPNTSYQLRVIAPAAARMATSTRWVCLRFIIGPSCRAGAAVTNTQASKRGTKATGGYWNNEPLRPVTQHRYRAATMAAAKFQPDAILDFTCKPGGSACVSSAAFSVSHGRRRDR